MRKSILASLTGLGTDRAVMETAIAAARLSGGHVTCLHARIDAVQTAAMIEVTFPQHHHDFEVLRRIGREEAERAESARRTFDQAVSHHGLEMSDRPKEPAAITVAWKQTQSFFNETVEEARYHDLIVMAKDSELSVEPIKAVLMQSGRPLLLAAAKPAAAIGQKIAIAWKAGAEAARAVTAAMPLLARAEQVFILTVSRNPEGDDRDLLSAERLATNLRRSGIKSEVQIEYVPSAPEAPHIQTMAYAKEADMLVMGAYGHSRFRELVLGGVTEEMLAGCAIPVLMFR